jgi:transcriptional regulator with XRE-family HTH domain
MTTFGHIIRELRQANGWTLRQLAPKVGVGFTYLSKVETGKLDFGDYPSEALIHRLADALETDEQELLILADKVPEKIRKRLKERPDAFRQLADLDDSTLDEVLANLDSNQPRKKPHRK